MAGHHRTEIKRPAERVAGVISAPMGTEIVVLPESLFDLASVSNLVGAIQLMQLGRCVKANRMGKSAARLICFVNLVS
jgi:hypothetical protein